MNRLILPRWSRIWVASAAVVLMAFSAHAQGPHFSHQTIFVTDLERAANFYEKVLQLKKIAEPFHDGKHVWFRISEHGQLHVVSGAKADIAHDINIHLAFSVPSMEALPNIWTRPASNMAIGRRIPRRPQLRPDKVKQVYLQDPDGYWIEINDDKFRYVDFGSVGPEIPYLCCPQKARMKFYNIVIKYRPHIAIAFLIIGIVANVYAGFLASLPPLSHRPDPVIWIFLYRTAASDPGTYGERQSGGSGESA